METMMDYHDVIYGPEVIDEVALVELISSSAVQRLKGVLQHGISGLISLTAPISRFDHSMGVMILVRRLGGSLEEQIAALLHDVSHTAFSHVIDYVFDGHDSQSYHDEVKEEYVAGTDLPAILAAHGFNWRDFIHESRYPLLEQPAPALCADRLDYFLRDSQELGLATAGEVADAIRHLTVADGRIAVDDLTAARWLALTYLAADEASWANFQEVGLYELAAQAIRRGLATGVLAESDIWGTDAAAWAKLQSADDPDLRQLTSLVRPQTRFVWDEKRPDFRVSTKLRTIDPDVLLDGRLRPLSLLDADYAQRRATYLHSKRGKWPMRIVPAGPTDRPD
jgi:uncharacterized protein